MYRLMTKQNQVVAVTVLVVLLWGTIGSVQAQAQTEDDGYVYPDDATEEEKDQIDEQEQKAWEDAGRPGEDYNKDGKYDKYDAYDKADDEDSIYYGDGPCADSLTSRACKDAIKDVGGDDDLPFCKWGVEEDCKVKDTGMICTVENTSDPCDDIYNGLSGESKAQFQKRIGETVEHSTYP